jgi:WXG100 family type VII secretion target
VSDLRVDPAALVDVAAQLNSVAEGLRSGLGSLDGEVSGLLGASWTGEAASAYAGVWREWHEGASHVVEGLTTMSVLLQQGASGYADTDSSTSADFAGSGL